MKKTILVSIIFLLMVFAGCKQTDDAKKDILSSEVQSNQVQSNKEAFIESTEDVLDHLANQDFLILGENLCDADDKTIVAFGEACVNLYSGAVAEQQQVSFEKYISNKNLREFTDKMLELTQKQALQGGSSMNYGVENKFEQAKLQYIEENLYYVELPFQLGGSGMGCKMLITAENKSLKLVDLYFGGKDGVDTFATGHPAVRKINNDNLWEDEEWVRGVFDKLKDFEERLDS